MINPIARAYGMPERSHMMQYTVFLEAGSFWEQRTLVAKLIPSLKWRWHGIGLMQAYVHEGTARELRVHIWSPRLILNGIIESGNAHNHRFTLHSHVLVGSLLHTEWDLTPDANGDHDLWDFPHARLQTEENRSFMRRLHRPCFVEKESIEIRAGTKYVFARDSFHSTKPLSDVVVTLVTKTDQVEQSAKVVAPIATDPVPAFSGDNLGELEPASLLDEAQRLLLGDSR